MSRSSVSPLLHGADLSASAEPLVYARFMRRVVFLNESMERRKDTKLL
jgi:hypothetical protein